MREILEYLNNFIADFYKVLYPITGAFIFMFISKLFRPKLLISKNIARNMTIEGEKCFEFKVINKGFFKVINVKAELVFNTNKQNFDGGTIPYATVIKLFRSNVMSIKPIFLNYKSGSGQFLFRTTEDLDKLWSESNYSDSSLSLSVYAVNEISNAPKVKRRFYKSRNLIIDGSFGSRNSCKIDKNNNES